MELSPAMIEKIRPVQYTNTIELIMDSIKLMVPERVLKGKGKTDLSNRKVQHYAKKAFKKHFEKEYFSCRRWPKKIWGKIPKEEGGIYLLYRDEEPVYIGMSETSIRTRIATHCKVFTFDGITWASLFEIAEVIPHICYRDLLELEKRLIWKLKPKYNIVHRR